jgi:hypothetical protein
LKFRFDLAFLLGSIAAPHGHSAQHGFAIYFVQPDGAAFQTVFQGLGETLQMGGDPKLTVLRGSVHYRLVNPKRFVTG